MQVPVYYKSLSELPIAVGWPFSFILPRPLISAGPWALGAPPPTPLPTQVSMVTLAGTSIAA